MRHDRPVLHSSPLVQFSRRLIVSRIFHAIDAQIRHAKKRRQLFTRMLCGAVILSLLAMPGSNYAVQGPRDL
jgi:hypothetical protein